MKPLAVTGPSRDITGRSVRVIPAIVQQHAEEAAALHGIRALLTDRPHVTLADLARFDERIVAHLDGLAIAGDYGWSCCAAALGRPSPGSVFTAVVRALDAGDREKLDRILALVGSEPTSGAGALSAFGWVEPERLRGVVAQLLDSIDAFSRGLGIAACSVHRVDPGLGSRAQLQDRDPDVRARALGTAGKIGKREVLSACTKAVGDEDEECRFWASWSAVLLGDRHAALDVLADVSLRPSMWRGRALRVSMLAMSVTRAHELLQWLARDAAHLRWLIQGSGIAGDPAYVPWLIGHMSKDQVARLAGEAFSLITGTDLALQDLERKSPENFESGPSDDPDDPNVDMDPDDGLPWPDPERVKDWWSKNSHRFQPGTRYFMGAPVTREHCIEVLKNGYQRQRILAAHYLCLLEPGTPLFNTSAPAWRQQRLLAEMR